VPAGPTGAPYYRRGDAETQPREKLFRGLAGEAESQAAIWAESARKQGAAVPPRYVPDARAKVVAALVRRHGPRAVRMVLAAMKVRGLSVYTHAQPGHPRPTSIEDMQARHRNVGTGGNLRAAVFGVNDGLVSNCSLILGVAVPRRLNSVILLSASPACCGCVLHGGRRVGVGGSAAQCSSTGSASSGRNWRSIRGEAQDSP
jgi:hypothetical protein